VQCYFNFGSRWAGVTQIIEQFGRQIDKCPHK